LQKRRSLAIIHGWDTWDIILGTHSSVYLLSSNVVCCRVHQAGKADRSKSRTKLAGAALVRTVVQTMGAVHLPGRRKQMQTSNLVHYETNQEVRLQPRVSANIQQSPRTRPAHASPPNTCRWNMATRSWADTVKVTTRDRHAGTSSNTPSPTGAGDPMEPPTVTHDRHEGGGEFDQAWHATLQCRRRHG
jgi:hypothetical protein